MRRILYRLVSFFRPRRAEDELAREIAAHLRLLEDGYLAGGMSAEDAKYAARRAFGGVEQTKEHQRAARSFGSIDTWWLDFRLGGRMMLKYPGLTLIAGAAMAVAIAIGTTSFAFFYRSLHPTLPFDEGDRIVGLENWDTSRNNQEDRILHDFIAWREELDSVQEIGAYSMVLRNLITATGDAEEATVAMITATGLRVPRVPPLLGRLLIEDDEQSGASQVLILGHDLWHRRFAADPKVVGQDVRLGSATYTIVGVMPPGFAFPMNHEVWIPLRANPADYPRRRGLLLTVFGRLAPGVTQDTAQAELALWGQRAAAAYPETHARLTPRVVRYTELWFDDGSRAEMHVAQGVVTLLVVLVSINVAILVYARTATRHAEIALRTALGAPRRRIIAQLFVEAFVLSSVAAGLGLLLSKFALDQARAAAKLFGASIGGAPFWMTFDLSTGAIVYTAGLALLAAVLAGVVPAIKATGPSVQEPLKQLTGGSSPRLGRSWTALIVAQVAFAVAFLPGAWWLVAESLRLTGSDPGFAVDEFLVARVNMDRETPPTADLEHYSQEYSARYTARFQDLISRVEREPEVLNVTVTSRPPGAEPAQPFEVEGTDRAQAGVLHVSDNFFDVFGVQLLAGRSFVPADVGHRRVIVSRSFAETVLNGDAIGRRIRSAESDTTGDDQIPWHEIVGVARDFPSAPVATDNSAAKVYYLTPPGADFGAMLTVRLRRGRVEGFADRLRAITTALDPSLRLLDLRPLTEAYRQEQIGIYWGAIALAVVAASVLLLSAAGLYALMSVTVSRVRKEIGIRIALGAGRHQILRSIFLGAFMKLSFGVVLGLAAVFLIDLSGDRLFTSQAAVMLPAISLFMIIVGLLAALGPARRGLSVNAIDTLKTD